MIFHVQEAGSTFAEENFQVLYLPGWCQYQTHLGSCTCQDFYQCMRFAREKKREGTTPGIVELTLSFFLKKNCSPVLGTNHSMGQTTRLSVCVVCPLNRGLQGLTLLGPQSRFGDKLLIIRAFCPHI